MTCDFSSFELFKQGAEARLSVGPFLGGKRAVLKERFAKKYRHPELDAKLTKDRFRGEVRSLVRCKTLPGIRTPTLYYVDPEKSLFVMEFVEGVTCRDYIRSNLGRDYFCTLNPIFHRDLPLPKKFGSFSTEPLP